MRRLLNLGSCCASLWITTKKVSSTLQYPLMALGCVVDFCHTSEPASASTVRLELLLTSSFSATSADSARCRRRSRYWKPSLCGRPSTPAPVRRTLMATRGMETEGAVHLWSCSEGYGLCYTTFLGDGDSSAFNAISRLCGG